MAFSRDNWQPIGGQSRRGSAPQLWSYTTTDAKTVGRGSGYFNAVSDDVTPGDSIFSYGSTGGTATMTIHIVLTVTSGGVVDCSDGTDIVMTNS